MKGARQASKPAQRLGFKKLPAPDAPEYDYEDEGPAGSDEDEEDITPDQLRALKRFRAGPAGSDDDGDMSDEDDEEDEGDFEGDDEEDGGDGSGGGGRGPGFGRPGAAGRDDDDDDDEDEDEDEEDDDEEDEDEGDEQVSGSGDERTLEEQVADVPFEVLEAIKRDGRGLVGQAARVAAARADAASASFKRANKDRPQEMSSKRPVGRFREVIQVPSNKSVDPRFDATRGGPGAGKDTFRRRYAFLYDDMLPSEKSELLGKMKKEKNPKFKARMQAQLQRLDAQLKDESLRRRTQALEREWKTKEKKAVSSGKQPFFLKAADKKKLELLAKYQELKEGGKLDKFMEKRRKKNAAKDHRYLPSARRADA
ncbi:hypothetical protein HYH02_011027 [Chlamydomonas schloesseri]|uniref:rRNA biogenesis protein RRP36 n=1 Tax=Chlamydomonas schloesseri TaxID=2026947 RepID=A0A835T6H5_9CHLO|nr:hypothetical protein HYH02_011027 [Chlamydomonas schloesseri]|eukprot:KAG2438331.1 hypothetical protein HYH02_011027 [Chlamydomonas schloesseri]